MLILDLRSLFKRSCVLLGVLAVLLSEACGGTESKTETASRQDQKREEKRKKLEQQAKWEAISKELFADGQRMEEIEDFRSAVARYHDAIVWAKNKERSAAFKRVKESIKQRKLSLMREAETYFRRGEFRAAIVRLEEAQRKYDLGDPLIDYNLAVCLRASGDLSAALAHLDRCINGVPEGKRREALEQLRAAIITPEKMRRFSGKERSILSELNRSIPGAITDFRKVEDDSNIGYTPCNYLAPLSEINTPSLLFNRAQCHAMKGEFDKAALSLRAYLTVAMDALDRQQVESQLSTLERLSYLPRGSREDTVRRHFAAAERYSDRRRHDLVIRELKAADLALPEFLESKRKLAVLYEMSGDLENARQYSQQYLEHESDDPRRLEILSMMELMKSKRPKYDLAIETAHGLLSEVLWVFIKHGPPSLWSSTGDTMGRVVESLEEAALLFPLGPELHELMAIVYQLTNSHQLALRSFDILWSQGYPVVFFTEAGIRVEISKDNVRLLRPPEETSPLVRLSGDLPEGVEVEVVQRSSITSLETRENQLWLTFLGRSIKLTPSRLGQPRMEKGPWARGYANKHALLFQRYLGLDNVILGNESLTKKEIGKIAFQILEVVYAVYDVAQAAKVYNIYNSLYYAVEVAMASQVIGDAVRILRQRELVAQNRSFKLMPAKTVRFGFRRQL